MKRLTILRHAKSSWGDPGLDDFDRPLNARGIAAARAVGKALKRRRVRLDHVLASPAKRVRETLDQFARGYGILPEIRLDDAIYLASPGTLLDSVRDLPEASGAPLLVGHNPGLERLLIELTRDDSHGFRDLVAQGYPTGALAIVELPAASWAGIEPASGEIVDLILPRELD
jgi:phosphohistidine phosphatase